MPNDDDEVPSPDRIRYVAQRVRARREERGIDQGDFKSLDPKGPSRQTVGALETRGLWPKTRSKRVAWSRVLGWDGDALWELATGAEPMELPTARVAVPERLVDIIRTFRDLADEALAVAEGEGR